MLPKQRGERNLERNQNSKGEPILLWLTPDSKLHESTRPKVNHQTKASKIKNNSANRVFERVISDYSELPLSSWRRPFPSAVNQIQPDAAARSFLTPAGLPPPEVPPSTNTDHLCEIKINSFIFILTRILLQLLTGQKGPHIYGFARNSTTGSTVLYWYFWPPSIHFVLCSAVSHWMMLWTHIHIRTMMIITVSGDIK